MILYLHTCEHLHRLQNTTREVVLNMDGWAFVGIFVVVAIVLLSVPLILSALLAPRKPNPIKSETY